MLKLDYLLKLVEMVCIGANALIQSKKIYCKTKFLLNYLRQFCSTKYSYLAAVHISCHIDFGILRRIPLLSSTVVFCHSPTPSPPHTTNAILLYLFAPPALPPVLLNMQYIQNSSNYFLRCSFFGLSNTIN